MLGRRGAQGPPLTLGCVGQTGSDVISGELWKISQNFVFGHPASQIFQNITDGNARTPDARLSKANGRIHGDPLEQLHGRNIPRLSSRGTITPDFVGLSVGLDSMTSVY